MHFRALVVTAVSAVLLACGSNGTGGTGGGSGSTGGGSGSTGGGSGSTGGGSGTGGTSGTGGGTSGTGGGTSGAGGGTSSTTSTGAISVSQTCVAAGMMEFCSTTAFATFNTAQNAGSSCTTTTTGECTVIECSPDGGNPPVQIESAGVITLTGTKPGIITLSPDGGLYNTYSSQQRHWDGGETLAISAEGAAVPAFMRTLVAPLPFTVTNPTCTQTAMCGDLPRGSPYMVSWSGGNTGALVYLTTTAPNTPTIICRFPSSPGAIPAAVLARVPTSGTTNISILPASESRFTSGAFDITITASANGTAGTVIVRD